MSRTQMTFELAHAAAMDAGNASMRKAGRTAWNEEDGDVCASTFNRLWPEMVERRVGARVLCNGGYEGTIARVCEWSDAMVEVRLARGTVCIDIADCIPLVEASR